MSTVDLGFDYVIESRDVLDARIAVLEERLRDACAEVDHASKLVGMEGPSAAAAREARELEVAIDNLRQVAQRVEKGYVFYQRFGFETAVDAMGEWLNWTPLSDASIEGAVYGHEDATTRIPLDAQATYRDVLDAGLFERFELAVHFETPGDPEETVVSGPWYHYLFGIHSCDTLGLFLIAEWKTTAD